MTTLPDPLAETLAKAGLVQAAVPRWAAVARGTGAAAQAAFAALVTLAERDPTLVADVAALPGDLRIAPAPLRLAIARERLDAGLALEAEGKSDDARAAYQRAAEAAAGLEDLPARDLAGRAALALGDLAGAHAQFEAIVAATKGSAAPAREQALLQLARVAYGSGRDESALGYYARVPRDGDAWLTALFEASWAHLRAGDHERALGNLLTLHSPFFAGRVDPESYILEAIVYFENCRYEEARAILAKFEADEAPVRTALAKVLAEVPTPLAGYELVRDVRARGAAAVGGLAAPAVERAAAAPEVPPLLAAIAESEREGDLLDGRSLHLAPEALYRTSGDLRERRATLIDRVGSLARARVGAEERELAELLSQSLRIRFETSGREKERLEKAGGAPEGMRDYRYSVAVADDEVYWPWDGEYWRDELGTYEYTLTRGCKAK